MTRSHRRKKHSGLSKAILATGAIILVILVAVVAVRFAENRLNVSVENAGQQMTSHQKSANAAQVFMNGRWFAQKDLETVLVMGIDTHGVLTSSGSYNNTNQVDFLTVLIRDPNTNESKAIHLNRDTMTEITVLGVTGQVAGTRNAQLALAFNYGNGRQVSSNNVVTAVEHLLYGMEIDHYITMTMDAVPIINDWAGGVTVEVLDDFSGIDASLVQGELVTLHGEQALTYVRTRRGLDDSSNLHRMERQRQYASAWTKKVEHKFDDPQAMADFLIRLDGYYLTDCTAEELEVLVRNLSENASVETHEIEGEAVAGETYMEYYVNEEALQQLILDLFYVPVAG